MKSYDDDLYACEIKSKKYIIKFVQYSFPNINSFIQSTKNKI